MTIRAGLVAGVLVALAAAARGADIPVPGHAVTVRPQDTISGTHRPASGTFPLPGPPTGATISFFDTAGPSAGNVTYSLDDSSWRGIGAPPGSAGWIYQRPSFSSFPCKRVTVKARVIKYQCRHSSFPVPDLVPPFGGELGIVLDMGSDRYCGQFGGITVENSAHRLRRRLASAPFACPVPACGAFVAQIGSGGSDPGELLFPNGVAIDVGGNVYVSNSGNQRIEKFTAAGAFVTSWGSFGTGDGQFNFPSDVAVDASGDVYVTDANNHRVQKFSGTGTFLTKWGTQGSGDGQFDSPGAVATDGNGDVYVSDTSNHRIQKFTSAGSFLTKWGVAGSGNGQFVFPRGIAVDAALTVFVADEVNGRVQTFTNTGTYVSQWGNSGPETELLDHPTGLAVDTDGDVYVTEPSSTRVRKFTSIGVTLGRWMSSAQDIAVNAAGEVLVAEAGNHRVLKFTCP
jgi:hypothetical protein